MAWQLLERKLLRLRCICWRLGYHAYSERYRLGPSFPFTLPRFEFYGDGAIEVSTGGHIRSLSTVQVCTGHRVRIGRRCRIAHDVRVHTQTTPSDTDFRVAHGAALQADAEIGDGVWIDANVFSVVGANSAVTRNVEPHSLCAGATSQLIHMKQLPGATSREDA